MSAMDSIEIDPRLRAYIETRDKRVFRANRWNKSAITEEFASLLRHGKVVVGGRATCGSGAADASWVHFNAWNEVVKKAASLGYGVEVTPIKHGNGWATKAGGFWHENEYRIVKPPTTEESSALQQQQAAA